MEEKEIHNEKSKGPIRTSAVVPFLIVVFFVGIYLFFFLDNNIKSALEWTGMRMVGAEVNVEAVDIDLLAPSLRVVGVQVTNPNRPSSNAVEFAELRFGLLWDGLLRGKLVVEDATVSELMFNTNRKKKGRLLEKNVDDGKTEPGRLAGIIDWTSSAFSSQVSREAGERMGGTVLEDAAQMLGASEGSGSFEDMETKFKSFSAIDKFESELADKEDKWNKRIEEVSEKIKGEDIKERLEKIKEAEYKTPAQIKEGMEKIKSIKKDVDQRLDLVKNSRQEIKSEINNLKKKTSDIKEIVNRDRKKIAERFSFPDLEVSGLSEDLFVGMVNQKFGWFEEAFEMAREYMPAKKDKQKTKKKPEPAPVARHEGRDYSFPVSEAYPSFWLKEAKISLKAKEGRRGSGRLKNITTYPPAVGQPAKIVFEGDFPDRSLNGVEVKVIMDHISSPVTDSLELKVSDYLLDKMTFSSSDNLLFGLNKGTGEVLFSVQKEAEMTSAQLQLGIKDIDYQIRASSPRLQKMLENSTRDISSISVQATGKDVGEGMDWEISSDLGERLSRSLKNQLAAEIKKAREKMQQRFQDKVDARLGKLDGKLNSVSGRFTDKFEGLNDKVAALKKESSFDLQDRLKEDASKKLEEKAAELLNNLDF
jgi:uncharacterized protein (TIGR03545 family)